MLVDAYPQSLLDTNSDIRFTPLHTMVNNPNENINDLLHIIRYLLEVEPSIIRAVDKFGRTPLLVACNNEGITLEVFKLLYSAYSEAMRIPEMVGTLPIHGLCCNRELDDNASLDILRFMLDADPGLAREGVEIIFQFIMLLVKSLSPFAEYLSMHIQSH